MHTCYPNTGGQRQENFWSLLAGHLDLHQWETLSQGKTVESDRVGYLMGVFASGCVLMGKYNFLQCWFVSVDLAQARLIWEEVSTIEKMIL